MSWNERIQRIKTARQKLLLKTDNPNFFKLNGMVNRAILDLDEKELDNILLFIEKELSDDEKGI